MLKLRTLPLAAALIFSPAPAMAQDLSAIFGPGPNPITMFKELFQAEPLTPAEEARLPAAEQVANSLMPPGSYGKAMEAAHHRIEGDVERDLWYAADGTLLKTRFKRSGYDITYVLK